jgi:hypothetical protein
MAITKVINDAVDLNQTSDYSGLRLPVGTTGNVVESFTTDYLVVGGGGGTQSGGGSNYPGGGGAGGLRTSYNNSTTTTNSLSFPSGKTAIATYMLNGDATDVSENYDGTAYNISYNTGKYGGAAVFNGSNSAIVLPNNILSSNFSVSAWFYLNSTSGNQYLFEFDYENRVIFRVSSTDNNWAYIGNSGYFNPGITYNTGQWYNVVITFSNGNPFKIYINGVLSYTSGNTSVSAFNNDNILGAANSSGSGAINGLIDQVRIYNTELSGTDVSNIYNNEVQALSGGGSAAESSLTLSEGVAYDVTVGGATTTGEDSTFSTITASGGGRSGGPYASAFGSSGGSGGGASGDAYSAAGGNGTLNQGYAGGSSGPLCSGSSCRYPGGGGGGAAGIGENATTTTAGNGGNGIQVNIIGGTGNYYAGGGGGSSYLSGAAIGGLGGGGNGSARLSGSEVVNDGASNTGGGGGGGLVTSSTPALGGSGVVILRYPTASVSSFTTTGTLNTPSTIDTLANNNYPVTNTAYYTLDGNANGYLTTNDLGTFDYPSGTGCIALYELNGNPNGYLTTTDLSTVNYPAGAGCIALYELNSNVADTSNTYNGSANNITYDTGAFGQAAVFNGSSSTINLNSNISNIFTDTFTFSAWLFITDNSTYNCIFSNGYGMEIYFYQGEFQLYSNNTNDGTSRNINGFVTTTTDYAVNQWHHLALVFTKTSQSWFINGQADGTNTTASYNPFDGNSPVLGYFFPSNQWHYNGQIDQVRVFNTALTQSQITTLARGIATSYSGQESNITYNTGAFGKAAIFNGSNSKITLSSTISGIKTYSFWINPDSSGNATYARRLFGDVGGTSYTNSITFDKPNSKVTYFEGTSARSSDTISNDTWSHIAFTSDGTTLKVYTNGSLSNTYTTSAFVSSIDEICSTASNRQFNGLIDQVRIFNTALSDANIATLARGAGTAYNGTWNGTEQYTPGRFDQAAKFTNDSTSWIDLLNTSTSVFSCSVWVKLDELGTTAQYIIGNSIEPSHPNDKNFNLYYRGDYNLNQFSFQSSEGYVGFGPTIQANRWYHVCWSGNNGTLTKVWVDGQEQSLPTVTRTFDSSGEWRVGVWRYRNSSNTLLSAHPLRGSVDQVRIFSTALLNNQVTDLYNEHYQTKFTDGSDTAIMFTQGTGTVTFNGINANAPQGAIRANTSHSEDGSSSVIEHYNGTAWKYFDAVKYCTTNTLNFPTGAGCVASYNLNNNVNDIENAYIGTNYNVTFNASGKFGAAGEFNGSNAFVDSGFTALSSTKASISFWVNIAAYTNYGGFVGDSTGQSKASRFFLGQGSGTSGNLWVSLGNGTTQWYDDTTVSLASYGLNNWFHLVGTVDGTSVKIYINGSLIHTFTSSISYAGAGTFPYYFGGWGSALLLNGELDQIRFFTTALTLAQVQDLYYNEVAC